MTAVWVLIFNCTVMPTQSPQDYEEKPTGTNLAFYIEKSYKSEIACLKDAAKGANRVSAKSQCYFVCNKGFFGIKK